MVDGRGNDFIHAQFARSDCSVCPHLTQCTSAKGRRRTVNFKPKELYEALQQNRRRKNAECQSTPPALQLTQPAIPAPRKHFQAPSGSFLYTMSTVPRACTGAPPGDVTNEAVY